MLQVEAILHRLLSTVGRMFRRVAIGFGGVFVAGAAITEGVSAAITRDFPTALTHVVAVVVGFSLALNVALAIAIEEGLRGFIHLMQDVIKATEKAAEKVVGEVVKEGGALVRGAENEIGQIAHGAGHLVQNVEHGAVTAVKDVVHIPGQIISGIEGGVQSVERRITGQQGDTNPR
jgi:hypothetical protein